MTQLLMPIKISTDMMTCLMKKKLKLKLNRLDKVVAKRDEETDSSEDAESADASSDIDNRSDSDKLRDDLKRQYGYEDMSDDQKRAFDERLDEVVGQETNEDEDPDQPEKVLRRTR